VLVGASVICLGWAASQFFNAAEEPAKPFTTVRLAAADSKPAGLTPSQTAAAPESKIGVVPTGKPCDSFDATVQGPPDPILGVTLAFRADASAAKIDGGVGAYRTEEGSPLVLDVVKAAEQKVLSELLAGKRNLEYLGQAGDEAFTKATRSFLFGADAACITQSRVATVQALSGTGALRLGGEFLRRHRPCAVVVPDPTWGNHYQIFEAAGLPVSKYRYFDAKTLGLDLEGMLADLGKLAKGTAVLLHVCAHNPTGVDPSPAQWQKILDVVKAKGLLPFFDSAYQGFASGDVDTDAYGVRLFERAGLELLVAQSYSKNMGLYGERVGALSLVCSSADTVTRVMSQLMIVVRANYSNPPKHGVAVAGTILNDPALLQAWKLELKQMVDRIASIRRGLRAELEKIQAPGSWEFMTNQIGMFTFTSLTPAMCAKLVGWCSPSAGGRAAANALLLGRPPSTTSTSRPTAASRWPGSSTHSCRTSPRPSNWSWRPRAGSESAHAGSSITQRSRAVGCFKTCGKPGGEYVSSVMPASRRDWVWRQRTTTLAWQGRKTGRWRPPSASVVWRA
jgi:aspartate/tyrosine/aromatic aminotransferase